MMDGKGGGFGCFLPFPSRKREGQRDLRAQRVSRSGVGFRDVQPTPSPPSRLREGEQVRFWSGNFPTQERTDRYRAGPVAIDGMSDDQGWEQDIPPRHGEGDRSRSEWWRGTGRIAHR
jgi:hypothetical protein